VPDRHHFHTFTQEPENKVENSGKFLDAKSDHPTHHDLPTTHHNFTTKTPHANTIFRKNPCKNAPPPQNKKAIQNKKISGPATAEPLSL
jgi:hypothetical protein